MSPKREIDLQDDLKFTRGDWKIERVGWAALAAFLAAGFLGLLGPGLFSRVSADGPLSVEYERFSRLMNEEEIRVRLSPGDRSLWVENRFLDGVRIRSMTPEPASVKAEPGWTVYTFEAAGDVDALLEVEPRKAGRSEGRFGVSPDRTVAVRQFVYP